MSYIKAVGFDMDHTLAPYDHINFETLAFQETLKKFIEAGYPEELSKLKFDPNSVIRGLLVDRERGNLLKVDAHKYCKLAFHGKRQLDKDDRHQIYNVDSFKAENLISVDTFFALSEVQLFIEIVDYMDRRPRKIQKSYKEVYQDLRKFIDTAHRDGSIKKHVIANPQKYVVRDKFLGKTLARLRDGGKQVFLLTNSDYHYTNAILNFILDEAHPDYNRWEEYFDQKIVSSGKPKFFTGSDPFLQLDLKTGKTKGVRGKLKQGVIYQGGSATRLQDLINVRGDEILYVGDHIYGDIIRSKGLFNWRTMLIVEELEEELLKLEETADAWEEIKDTLREKEEFDEDLQKIRSKRNALRYQLEQSRENNSQKVPRLEKDLSQTEEKLLEKEKVRDELDKTIKNLIDRREYQIHPAWGEVMKAGLEKSRFARQVELYACIYSSRVTNLRYYSPTKRFISLHDRLPHEF